MDLTNLNVLLIEDELKVAKALVEGLTAHGCIVKHSATGEDGFFESTYASYDLVVLDLNLPGRDGIEVLRTIRKQKIRTPVIVLTARDSVEDRVTGLDAGADDYLTKPFAFPELLARMKALLRRGQADPDVPLVLSDLGMHPATRTVSRGKTVIHLTARETDLLEYLLRHRDTVVTRTMIARDVWHVAQRVTPLDNVIDVHIAHLRKKIDETFPTKLLHTLRGVGFILSEKRP